MNRPSPFEKRGIEVPGFVKPGINYGSVAGSSAKFIGQGILNLRRGGGGPTITPQFILKSGTNANTFLLTPGSVNNIVVSTTTNIPASSTFIVVNIATSSGSVVSGTTQGVSEITAQTPTPNFPPASVMVPLYKVESGVAYRILGAWGIDIFAKPVGLDQGTGADPFTAKYVWGVMG